MKTKLVLLSVIFLSLLTVSLSFDDVFALKAEGVSVAKYGSGTKGTVCGDKLCSEIPGGYEAWKKGTDKTPEKQPVVVAEEEEEVVVATAEKETPEAEEKYTADDHNAAAAEKHADDDHGAMPESEEETMMPPATTMTELTDNIYHYFGAGYSSLVIISPTDILITDPANDMRAELLKEEIAKITDVSVTKIALTHEHYDHAGGTTVFEGAEIICQSNCQDMFELDAFAMTPQTVDVTFDDFLSFEIGTTTVELHYFGPGDGEATTIIYLPDEQIIASADLYSPKALTPSIWMDDKNYSGVHAIFNAIKDWPITHAVNGHSPGTDPVDLYENIDFVNDLHGAVVAEVMTAMEEGGMMAIMGLIGTLPESMTLEKYEDWSGYDEHLPKHVERMLLSLIHGD